MIFIDEHSPSISAKVLMSIGVLAGTLAATTLTTGYSDWFMNVMNFEIVEGNIYRQIVMFICCFIYFIKFTIGLFVFIQRKISLFEGCLVTVLFFMMFYFFGISAGSHPDSIGIIVSVKRTTLRSWRIRSSHCPDFAVAAFCNRQGCRLAEGAQRCNEGS